jgi:Mg2+ transporter MgtE
MLYLTKMVGKPVIDAAGERIGTISDLAIATGEIFPKVTAVAFTGPDKTPFMLSWRKFVETFDGEQITLNVPRPELRFSYLQPDEVLLARDLLNKQIVDTQGMKVVRVNDLKLAESRSQLRLLGADVGVRGLLRAVSPALESGVLWVTGLFGRPMSENLIAWNYMDLLDRDLSHVKLSVTHKRLGELHPADVADILEQLSPAQRAKVFRQLDNVMAAEAISEMEDEFQAETLDDLTAQRASDILEEMDPDDAADVLGDLPYDKAETLLRLMGVDEQAQVRRLLGFKDKTAGGIMTSEVTTVMPTMCVSEVIDHLRTEAAEYENIYYVYVVDEKRTLLGVVSLRDLIVATPETSIEAIYARDLITVGPDEDQEEVADTMSKYDLLALPVVDEGGRILGIVTVDDALEVMEEESAEDLAIATGSEEGFDPTGGTLRWIARRSAWVWVWASIGVVLAVALRAVSSAAEATTAPPTWLMTVGNSLTLMVLLPVVLRMSEDIAARARAELIEDADEDERVGFWRRFGHDALSGFALALVAGIVMFGVAWLANTDPNLALFIGAAAGTLIGLTVLLTVLAGALVVPIAQRIADRGGKVSGTTLTVTMQIVAAVIYVALALGVTAYATTQSGLG